MHDNSEQTIDGREDMDAKADRHEREIEGIRDNLGGLLSELGRRRHRLAPRLLIRNHPLAAALIGLSAVAAVGGGLLLHARHVRRQHTLSARFSRLTAGWRRATGPAIPAAKTQPPLGRRIVIAVSTAIAGTAARHLLKRYVARELGPFTGSPLPSSPRSSLESRLPSAPEVSLVLQWPLLSAVSDARIGSRNIG